MWISSGSGRRVGEFTLNFVGDRAFKLPMSQICCNVVVLKLCGNIHFNIPAANSLCFPSLDALHLQRVTCVIASSSSINLPNLKIMRLECVKFKNKGSVFKLLSSSPVLDDLYIDDASSNYKVMEDSIIHLPSLTRLSLLMSTLECEMMYKLKINAPALGYLYLNGLLTHQCLIVENFSSLLQADLRMFFDYDNVNVKSSIVRFIGRLSKVKFLHVTSDIMKAFRIVSTNITSGFHNLTRLEIRVHCIDLSMLIGGFLDSMDNLEHLVMKTHTYGGITCPDQSWWIEPLNVPKCLMSRLTTISFSAITIGCRDQRKLLRYFMKNAKVLQMLTLGNNRISEELQIVILEKISLMPRGSRTCQVAFT